MSLIFSHRVLLSTIWPKKTLLCIFALKISFAAAARAASYYCNFCCSTKVAVVVFNVLHTRSFSTEEEKRLEKNLFLSLHFFAVSRSNWTNGILCPREIPMENDDGHKDLAQTAKFPTLPATLRSYPS